MVKLRIKNRVGERALTWLRTRVQTGSSWKLTAALKRGMRLALVAGLLSGCAYTRQQAVDPDASLYERLGGRPGITAVLKDFSHLLTQDERINGFFIGVDLERVDQMLYEQICEVTGGPCKYTGREMKSLHTGMNITEAQFNALVEDLARSLSQNGVAMKEQQELLSILGSLKNEIVNR